MAGQTVGIGLDIRGSAREVIADLGIVEKSVVPQATAAALNRTATTINAKARREIAATANVQQKHLRGKISIKRANRRKRWVSSWFGLKGINPVPVGMDRARQEAAKEHGWVLPEGYRSKTRYQKFTRGSSGAVKWRKKRKKSKHFPKGMVLTRRTKNPYPTRAVTIRLQPWGEGVWHKNMEAHGPRTFRKRFEREIIFRMKSKHGSM